jgi:hypothetical protein
VSERTFSAAELLDAVRLSGHFVAPELERQLLPGFRALGLVQVAGPDRWRATGLGLELSRCLAAAAEAGRSERSYVR